MVVASAVVFLVSLLIGALGIYVGARIIVGATDFDHAIVTALLGAIAWSLAGYLVGWIPLVGPLVALGLYVAVIKWRYRTEWTAAAMIGLLTWLTVLLVMYGLATLGITGFEPAGVPDLGEI